MHKDKNCFSHWYVPKILKEEQRSNINVRVPNMICIPVALDQLIKLCTLFELAYEYALNYRTHKALDPWFLASVTNCSDLFYISYMCILPFLIGFSLEINLIFQSVWFYLTLHSISFTELCYSFLGFSQRPSQAYFWWIFPHRRHAGKEMSAS